MVNGSAEEFFASSESEKYRGRVQLIFTSPPFPLNRKKRYGNQQGDAFREWLSDFAPVFVDFLKPSGSIVLELGNAWEPGKPVMSTLATETLLEFLTKGKLNLCQQFVAWNRARLPSPAQWVNVERIRVKDAITHIWWMAPSVKPKANNRRVLNNYSPAMRDLLRTRKYNAGKRPSEHNIGKRSFLRNNGGSIPSNVLDITNTSANDDYLDFCREHRLVLHPSRMPTRIADFFIRFLTTRHDVVMDPFSGSNTTGAVAEMLDRKWISIEPQEKYIRGSLGRFRSGPHTVTAGELKLPRRLSV